jgi:hypothetical protein
MARALTHANAAAAHVANIPPVYINIARLSNWNLITDSSSAEGLSRRLVQAFWMGQNFKNPHFMDAVMNQITRNFRSDLPPSQDLVAEVYNHTTARDIPTGLKRFMVDYYIWSCYVPREHTETRSNIVKYTKSRQGPAQIQQADIPELNSASFDPKFVNDVQKTLQRIRDRGDLVVDCRNVEDWLKTKAPGPTGRCRYHQHTDQELCFSLLV